MAERFKALIFDLDGTVANTKGDLSTAINSMRNSYGYETLDEELVLRYINYGVRDFILGNMPERFREDETLYKEAYTRYQGFYEANLTATTYIYPGMEELISKFLSAGYGCSVLSNKQDRFTKRIIKTLLPDLEFTETLGACEAFPHKPDPASAVWCAGRMGALPEEVVFVGDSNVDMETAVNAGMFPAGVTWGYRSREVLISSGAKAVMDNAAEIWDFIRSYNR